MMSTHAMSTISNTEKDHVWQAYRDHQAVRVPVTLGANPRVVILNEQWNPEGYTFQQAAEDPRLHLEIALRHALYMRTVLNHYTDNPTGLPEFWDVGLNVYNVYEAAILGAPLDYLPGQVPDTKVCLGEENKLEIFEQDISQPLENSFIKDRLVFWQEMEKIAADMQFEGRPIRVNPWALCGTDGPVTVAMNLRGPDFMEDLLIDPDYADRLMRFIMQAAINRRAAFEEYWGDRIGRGNGMADDSIAMLSTPMYQQQVLPIHRMFYESVSTQRSRGMHLCGNATRHFPLIHEHLGVTSFDTGFPVDFGNLRQELGDDVEVSGGVEVALLMNGTADEVYERTKAILQSGIKQGGRFIMREGNNLPPNCPLDTLEAMYQATLEYGRYDD
tara:strand:- start:68835 stop:69995 length:1161 start_codon:yes stop_codon:yes gene_type:complete